MAGLKKASLGFSPGLKKALLLLAVQLACSKAAVADWPLEDIWGDPEQDWQGRWWRRHLPTGSYMECEPGGYLAEPIFTNGWNPQAWHQGQYVGDWPAYGPAACFWSPAPPPTTSHAPAPAGDGEAKEERALPQTLRQHRRQGDPAQAPTRCPHRGPRGRSARIVRVSPLAWRRP